VIAGRTRDEHLFGPGPKRVLALDGGGVRGVISLAYLERLEAILRERFGPETVLADYFDLIGGASTGAIIATGLALGLPVERLIATYLGLADKGFRRSSRFAFLAPKFQAGALLEQIRAHVGDATLGSARLKTGLAIIAKRIDTGSVWVFHNNPRGRWFDGAGSDPDAVPNKDLQLTQLLRASTAAPSYFAPETIEIARGISGTFIDGAVSPHGNPGLLLFLLATIRGYGFRWPTGAELLLLASVGTGHHPMTPARMPAKRSPPLLLAALALRSVMDDCNWLNQTLLQYLGQSPVPWHIDSEIGDLSGDQLGLAPAFHYLRYDMVYSSHWFDGEIGVRLEQRELDGLTRFDEPAISPRLLELARFAARKQILDEHLPAGFDLR
jgi:uncharacterized protein